jgi:acyl carrier protein
MSIREEVIANLKQVASEQDTRLAPLTDDLTLADSGLDSLGFAVLVARLETAFGVDPFSESEDGRFPETLGDFIHLYEHAAK